MLDEDKPFRETASMAAVVVDGWLKRNRAQIANGAGLTHSVRRALMDDITRTFASVVRRADRFDAAAVAGPAGPKALRSRPMKPADAAKLLPFKGKILLPGEAESLPHPPAPKGGRKRKATPPVEGPPDAA